MFDLLSETTEDARDSFSPLLSDSDDFDSPVGNSKICSNSVLSNGPEVIPRESIIGGGCSLESSSATHNRISEAHDWDTIPHVPVDRQATKPVRRHQSAERIEEMVVELLEEARRLCTTIPSAEGKTCGEEDDDDQDDDGPFNTHAQFFRRRMGANILRLAQFFRVADLAHEAILEDLPATKRDLFYKDVPLFKRQSVVDKIVDGLAATINTERAHLNIRASQKGLVCGAGLSIQTVRGDVIHTTESEGTLIPVAEDILSLDVPTTIKWVLILEKEAVFQMLRQLCFMQHPAWKLGNGIMITGKGYPDLATRQLVKNLSDKLPPTVPIVALVDGDAYGLDIVSVYKFGSKALRHEASKLATLRVECIGIWASELTLLGVDKEKFIQISQADEKKARSMLKLHRELPDRWRTELTHMLETRRKAETEILSSVPWSPGELHPLIRYVRDKVWQCICHGLSEVRTENGG